MSWVDRYLRPSLLFGKSRPAEITFDELRDRVDGGVRQKICDTHDISFIIDTATEARAAISDYITAIGRLYIEEPTSTVAAEQRVQAHAELDHAQAKIDRLRRLIP
jgi:hypothetical protein